TMAGWLLFVSQMRDVWRPDVLTVYAGPTVAEALVCKSIVQAMRQLDYTPSAINMPSGCWAILHATDPEWTTLGAYTYSVAVIASGARGLDYNAVSTFDTFEPYS